MGLKNAIRRVYRLQMLNLLRLLKWLFWGAAFFGCGVLTGINHAADGEVLRTWMFVGFGVLAVVGFLLRLWEWRLNRAEADRP